mmetsp:Transcript_18003/g.58212  ORF Transcript_18003/g.58212 Transcript_18003/m.58212 type:complete len:602 (+) Transcript_18003:116-1921(+)
MRLIIALGVLVACAQFLYLATLTSQRGSGPTKENVIFIHTTPSFLVKVTGNFLSVKKLVAAPIELGEQVVEGPSEHEFQHGKPRLQLHQTPPEQRLDADTQERVLAKERSELLQDFVREIHLAFGAVRPMSGFGVKNSPHRATDATVWMTFHEVVSRLLYSTPRFSELRRHTQSQLTTAAETDASFQTRRTRMFVSVSSFRDEACPDTLTHMYDQASEPLKIAVGVVQQNCDPEQHAQFGCFTAVMPEDMKVHPAPPDVDCVDAFCKKRSSLCEDLRRRGLLRILRFNESETFGPIFGRYLGSMLWQNEEYYAQVDAHTTFAENWDAMLKEDYAIAPSFPKAVFSHYPPSGPQKPGPLEEGEEDNGFLGDTKRREIRKYPWEGAPGPCMCDAGFAEFDIIRVGAMQRYPYKEFLPPGCDTLSLSSKKCRRVPRFAPYIGAGFVFANASFLYDVPFDPFLPFAFMGEELDFSTRLWTAGWDIFCPPRSVLAHAYLRPQKPKFWGALQRSIGAGAHNSLQKFVLPRIKHKVGYPEARILDPPSLADHLDDFGLGNARPLRDYLHIADLDFAHKRGAEVSWCKTGDRPPTAPPALALPTARRRR